MSETNKTEEQNKTAAYTLLRDIYKTKFPGRYKKLVDVLKHLSDVIGTDAMLYVLMDEVRKLKK